MKRNAVLFLIGLLFIAAAIALFVFNNNDKPQESSDSSSRQESAFQPKTDPQGGVEITVLPIDIAENARTWDFRITTNTHTVEIENDFMNAFELADDKGTIYKPVQWEGTAEGHHRTGILSFEPLESLPVFIEIRAKEIGEIPLRIFRWDLN